MRGVGRLRDTHLDAEVAFSEALAAVWHKAAVPSNPDAFMRELQKAGIRPAQVPALPGCLRPPPFEAHAATHRGLALRLIRFANTDAHLNATSGLYRDRSASWPAGEQHSQIFHLGCGSSECMASSVFCVEAPCSLACCPACGSSECNSILSSNPRLASARC